MRKFCCLFLLALATACPGAEHRLKPSVQFSIDKKGARPTDRIDLIGVPWANFSRGFLRFDLNSVKTTSPGQLKQALLVFKTETKSNPNALPLEIAVMQIDYDPAKADWSTPGFPDSTWPKVGKYVNIDHAAQITQARKVTPSEGITAVDVTAEVRDWLSGKTPNYGFFLKIGPKIGGLPNSPAWDVSLKDFELQIDSFDGVPGESPLDRETLAIYPSALLPPISDPYYFLIFVGEKTRHPSNVINMMGAKRGQARPERGILPLAWQYGPQTPAKTEEKILESYTSRANRFLGIEVDEWQGNRRAGEAVGKEEDPNRVTMNDKIDWSIKGIIEAKKINPAFFVLVYWRAEDSIIPLLKMGYPDLLVLEAQSNLHKRFPKNIGVQLGGVIKRLEFARKLGVIDKTIPLFGFFLNEDEYHPDDIATTAHVEKWIRTSREKFPEMPGFAFYAGSNTSKPGSYAAELLKKAEELCYQYYILPAPEVSILSPGFESVLRQENVTVRAQAESPDGNPIKKYRFFVDNRLMAESENPEFTVKTGLYGNGRHIITVHAIDSKWNRGVAQLPVTFELPPRK